MHQIFELLKVGYKLKRCSKKCLKYPKGSQEHMFAKYYDEHFKELEDTELTLAHIDTLKNQIDEQRNHPSVSDQLQELFSRTESFLDVLKHFVKH